MVLPQHFPSRVGKAARQGIADDRAAKVPDVHFLGQIWRGVVDDHPARLAARGLRVEDPRDEGAELRLEYRFPETQVDEARARDAGFADEIIELSVGKHGLRELPRGAL